MSIHRRHLLAGFSALGLVGLSANAAAIKQPYQKIGLQLYTVRDVFAADPAGTLQKVHDIGYRRVETTNFGGMTATDFKALLDRIGLAGPLTAESAKVMGAAAVLVLHRPESEDGLFTGRAFHRAWLRFTEAGFVGAVMAALADDDASRNELARTIGLPAGRRIVTTFRIGRSNGTPPPKRARLDPADLLI